MSTQIEVSQVVALIGSAYPNFSATKETVSVYYELLKDLDADLLKTAALQCCAEAGRKFAPSIGELRGAATSLRARAQRIPSALEAWDEVCKAPQSEEIKTVSDEADKETGRYIIYVTPYKWSHPLVRKVAKMMGWPEFPGENESTDRAHFFRQYEIEVMRYSETETELPAVTNYLTRARTDALPMGEALKQLKGRNNGN